MSDAPVRSAPRPLLLVEDNVNHAEIIERGLGAESFEILHVRTGAKAIEFASSRTFDVFLVDYRLPDRRGVEVCRRLREEADEALILLVTSIERDELVEEAFQAGVNDYVVKGPSFVDRIEHAVQGQTGG